MNIVYKGWGQERIFASTETYCGKFLEFKTYGKTSYHFHRDKDETFYVLTGKFRVHLIDPRNAMISTTELKIGDTLRIRPLDMHQIECVEEGVLVEVSTADRAEDSYRVMPGDSQQPEPAIGC